MSQIEDRLRAMGFELPTLPAPVGNFEYGSIDNRTLYLSGQGPVLENGQLARGKVGLDVTTEDAYHHAQRTGLVLIAAMKHMLGSLEHVVKIQKVFGMVNATPDFADHPAVINGCSDLFNDVFGEAGRHARAAVGMGSLPGQITVEIDAIISISPSWREA